MKTFEVKEEHLKLLKRLQFSYDDYSEFGAPIVDPKRPYGNSDVYSDIGEILGYVQEDYSSDEKDYFYQLHRDMETILQILVINGHIETDIYQSHLYGTDWKII